MQQSCGLEHGDADNIPWRKKLVLVEMIEDEQNVLVTYLCGYFYFLLQSDSA